MAHAYMQSLALLTEEVPLDEASAILEGAPYLLDPPGRLEVALEELRCAFPGQPAAYVLLQHVRVGADGRLWRGKAPY